MTPEVDLTESGDSFAVDAELDVVLSGSLSVLNRIYANGTSLAHPYVSPLDGDFAGGYTPTFVQAGTRDLFLSNAVRFHRALRRAGVEAELHSFEAMPHGGFFGSPENVELEAETRRFAERCWSGNRGRSHDRALHRRKSLRFGRGRIAEGRSDRIPSAPR